MTKRWTSLAAIVVALVVSGTRAETQTPAGPKPILYLTATAHLDSQWNWTVQDTIRSFVPDTFYTNFKYFETYPRYVFSYEGAIHYMWFKEYHPDDWSTVQKYVANNRWRLAGSWINAVDVNVPSPESLMRQALYGKRFFREEFGKVSNDVYLPDCFGFSFALPSIAAHVGQTSFITAKLAPAWGPAIPTPFPIGRWKGPDGRTVIALLRPGAYDTHLQTDISMDPQWSLEPTTVAGGRQVMFRLFGTGDVGGGPTAESMEFLKQAMANPNAKIEIRNTSPDQLSRDLTAAETASLPEYEGELVMRTHGVGTYTSQAAMKKFNRQNELLADSAERAAVAADWLTGLAYPTARLREAWTRFLWHQFHDDITGTSIPQAYQFSWNDELMSANQFAGVLTSSTSAVASLLDTQGFGVPLVVYNPIARARHDLVEATVEFPAAAMLRPGTTPNGVVVSDGKEEWPAQVLDTNGLRARILFPADVPSTGYRVMLARVRDNGVVFLPQGMPKATPTSIENTHYTVTIDANGDISSIVDREARKELLRAPIRLEMRNDPSPTKPAWQILYDTINGPVREYVAAPTIKVVENGPWRAALEITRHAAGSTIVQRVSLTQGGDRVDVESLVDWKSPNTLLKAAFPFAASNPKATYDLGLGTIERGNNTPDKYEVPAQKWADITDASGSFGATVLNDSKYGWDKPADNILRLTLLHTALPRAYPYQGSNDLGQHRFVYSIAGHAGDWRRGRVPARAASLNQPLMAFQTDAHAGALGRSFSLVSLADPNDQVGVVALKKAEDTDEIVVRVQERYGRAARTTVAFAGRVVAAREINAAEEPVGPLPITNGGVVVNLTAYQPRTIAVRLAAASLSRTSRTSATIALPFNLDGVSADANRHDGDFDGKGHTIPAELFPARLDLGGVPFSFGSGTPRALNVLVPSGQTLAIPAPAGAGAPGYNRLYVIAAAVGSDVTSTIAGAPLTIREWEGAIGQWNSRLRDLSALREPFVPTNGRTPSVNNEIRPRMVIPWDPQSFAVNPIDIDAIQPGFVTREEIAWVGTHRHAPDGNQAYIQSCVFAYAIDLPAGARTITLPNDARLRVFAATVVREPSRVRPAGALYSADLKEK